MRTPPPNPLPARQGGGTDDLPRAILSAVAYSDVFDYPVTLGEIHRYLVGVKATLDEVRETIQQLVAHGALEQTGDLYHLPGRADLAATRLQREAHSERLWRQAVRYGRWIAHIPYVRMVAITGALASRNVENGADLDYLIVTEPGRLWICRALIVALTVITAPFGAKICPNYLLARHALGLIEQELFTAQELARMIPLSGRSVYHAFRESNGWADRFIPNAPGSPDGEWMHEPGFKPLQAVGEWVLGSGIGEKLEAWEMRRKIEKLSQQVNGSSEVHFSAEVCKGHFDQHGERIMRAYEDRVAEILRT